MPVLGQHLDQRPGQAKLALRRLVGIGDRADVDHRRLVTAARQGLSQTLCSVDLGDDAGLEVQPGRQVEIAVGRPRVAVNAAMLTTAVRVDREIETDVRGIVARQNGLDPLLEHLGAGRQRLRLHRLLQRAPAVVIGLALILGEPVRQLPGRATALDRLER